MKILVNKEKKYIWRGGDLNTEDGLIKGEDILKGSAKSSKGVEFSVLDPRFMDFFEILKRGPQVILPKDAAIMIIYAGVEEGERVVEIGTGSGWLTIFLAKAVGERGKVITYEIRKEFIEIARKNLETLGFLDRVEIRNEDPFEVGIPECDHLFVDVKECWRALELRDKVRRGGFIVFYCPQITQVLEIYKRLTDDLRLERVVEIIEREWVIRDKVCRPKHWLDHTGFLVFLRRI